MFFIFFSSDTWYLLNVFVQSIGYYLQWIIQLGFHTDAFAQQGNAPDGKEAPGWIDGWTIFYCKFKKSLVVIDKISYFLGKNDTGDLHWHYQRKH